MFAGRRGQCVRLEGNAPPWLDRHLHASLERSAGFPRNVREIRNAVHTDVAADLYVCPPRCAAQPDACHTHYNAAEHPRRRTVVRRQWVGQVVAALALPAMRGVESQRRARDNRQIESQLELVVIAEATTEADAEDLVLLRRILVVVGEV